MNGFDILYNQPNDPTFNLVMPQTGFNGLIFIAGIQITTADLSPPNANQVSTLTLKNGATTVDTMNVIGLGTTGTLSMAIWTACLAWCISPAAGCWTDVIARRGGAGGVSHASVRPGRDAMKSRRLASSRPPFALTGGSAPHYPVSLRNQTATDVPIVAA